MTLPGQVPWLFDMLPVPLHNAQQVFDTYVRDNSVLLTRSGAAITCCATGGRNGRGRGCWPAARAKGLPGLRRSFVWREAA